MKELLRNGADVHARDYHDTTCLIAAARSASVEEVKLLIKYGADVTAQNQDGISSLHMASRYSYEAYDIIQILLDNGADVNARDYLLFPIFDIYKVDINTRDDDGNTPLHLLIDSDSVDILTFCRQSSIDLNAQNHEGETPLHRASGTIDGERIAMLIKHGANVNSVDNRGRTPLDHAFTDGTANLLIESGGKRGTT
ncbi:hypothetical protein FLAG1_08353 [Fusarium langsethiae]|uniref:Uncharacterized protein n=1 Tax=Fusarium langsethiae TaxID=179993 RepID=A0A0N0DCW2_FUSLA|nr:hypothetical protein FLAG1_08353 [Fusarium langsethiae]